MKKISAIIFIVSILSSFASETDSLLNLLPKVETKQQIEIYEELAGYQEIPDSALMFLEKALDLATEENDKQKIAELILNLPIYTTIH